HGRHPGSAFVRLDLRPGSEPCDFGSRTSEKGAELCFEPSSVRRGCSSRRDPLAHVWRWLTTEINTGWNMGTSPLFSSKLCFSALVLLSDLYEVSRRGRIDDWNRPWEDAFTSQRPGARLRSGLSKQSRPWDGGILSLSSGVLLPGERQIEGEFDRLREVTYRSPISPVGGGHASPGLSFISYIAVCEASCSSASSSRPTTTWVMGNRP
ncbi:hypothetical protein U1Q18_036674, partial [Sarracenia purpurea var. burkii]